MAPFTPGKISTRDKFIEWWHGPATQYIAANAAMKFQQSKDNNNLSNWKTRGSPTKLNSEQQVPSFATLALPHNSVKIVDLISYPSF
jgi:hypothetical protein